MPSLEIGFGSELSLHELEKVAYERQIELFLSPQAEIAIEKSYYLYQKALKEKKAVYGSSTGFGPLVEFSAAEKEEEQVQNLLEHLACGSGNPVRREIVQVAFILRLHVLAQGYSGVSLNLVPDLAMFLKAGLIPKVPEIGSLGASGDLIPLAHLFRTFAGKGEFWDYEGIEVSEVLKKHGLKTLSYTSRDALALVNGLSFSLAILAFATWQTRRLILFGEKLTAALYSLLGARRDALDLRYSHVRNHEGQTESCKEIRMFLRGVENPQRPLQEVYSIRGAPQIFGAIRKEWEQIFSLVQNEVNGVSDNPLFFESPRGEIEVIHGANFFGQNLAFAADRLNMILTQMGILAERQIAALLNPQINNQAPAMLAFMPGRQSALAGAQLLSTALLAEMRSHCQMHSTMSIPTNGVNQDVVPMAALAARSALSQAPRLAEIFAVLNIALNQYYHVAKAHNIFLGCSDLPEYLMPTEPIYESRTLQKEIQKIREKILNGN